MSNHFIENKIITEKRLSDFPMFRIEAFKDFFFLFDRAKNNVLIHIFSNEKVYSFSNKEDSDNINLIKDDNFLDNFPDDSMVRMERWNELSF